MATQNKGKIKELKELLSGAGIEIVSLADAGFPDFDIEENGASCEENSLIKARAASDLTGLPAIADDAGLFVDALGGAPGVHSARYAGVHGDDAANRRLLLQNMEGIPDEKRSAHFLCVISFVSPGEKEEIFTGRCDGQIGYSEIGDQGFGYDSIFIPKEDNPKGLTFAQISLEEKNKKSHRAKALALFREYLNRNA